MCNCPRDCSWIPRSTLTRRSDWFVKLRQCRSKLGKYQPRAIAEKIPWRSTDCLDVEATLPASIILADVTSRGNNPSRNRVRSALGAGRNLDIRELRALQTMLPVIAVRSVDISAHNAALSRRISPRYA